MDSLVESVVAKRDELAKLEQQNAERAARIAALQAKPQRDIDDMLADLKSKPLEIPVEPPKVVEEWRPPEPERILPELTEEEMLIVKRPVQTPGVGQTGIIEFSKDSPRICVRVLSQPDAHGCIKVTPTSGIAVGRVFDASVKDFV